MFWPDEDCYSEVAVSKMLESKEQSVGQTDRVKKGCKTFTGVIENVIRVESLPPEVAV